MDRLVAALILAIPATVPATVFGWLSIEYALGIVWAAVFLIFALGLWTMLQRTPRAATQHFSASASARRGSGS
jgi:hypothetical protein